MGITLKAVNALAGATKQVGRTAISPFGIAGRVVGNRNMLRATKYGAIGVGAIAAGGTLVGGASLLWNAPDAYRSYQRTSESMVMSRMILNAQSGPYGPSAASMGMRPGNANTAGLVLASHYAKNRNKHFGMFGLRYL